MIEKEIVSGTFGEEVIMAKIKLKKWDSAEHLKTDEDMVLYLEAGLEEAGDDAAFNAKALGNIARAKGMTQLAKETGLGRESLYKALSGEQPCLMSSFSCIPWGIFLQHRIQNSE